MPALQFASQQGPNLTRRPAAFGLQADRVASHAWPSGRREGKGRRRKKEGKGKDRLGRTGYVSPEEG